MFMLLLLGCCLMVILLILCFILDNFIFFWMWVVLIDSVYVYIDGKNYLEICMVNSILKCDLFVVIKMILFICVIILL